jgi:hypothetical protein
MIPRRLTWLLALALLGACGESGPGDVTFSLTTPNQDDGAIQFTILAPESQTLGAVTAACTGCEVFVQAVTATEVRGVLLGPVAAGPVLLVSVSDRGTDDYTATIQAVASRTYQLRDIPQYTLRRGR